MSIEMRINKALSELAGSSGRLPDPKKWTIFVNFGDYQDLGGDLDTKELFLHVYGRSYRVVYFMDGFSFRGTVALFFEDNEKK